MKAECWILNEISELLISGSEKMAIVQYDKQALKRIKNCWPAETETSFVTYKNCF